MQTETHRLAAWLAAALSLAAAGCLALMLSVRSLTGAAGCALLVPAALLAVLAALHLAFLARESAEAADREAAPAEHRLFDDAARFQDASRARAQFERWMVPIASLAVGAVEVLLARWLWSGRVLAWGVPVQASAVSAENGLFAAALLAGVAFAAFATGRVVAALAAEREAPALLPAAHTLLLSVATAGGGAAILLGGRGDSPVTARVVALVLAVTAGDRLLTLGLDLYRARGRGRQRVAYDGRLVALVARPSRLVDNLAATLDYQFGWTVSRTQFYAAARRALAPLLCFQAVALWLLSCVQCVGPGDQALLYRLGRLQAGAFGPGAHLLWPWPIDRLARLPANRLLSVSVGGESTELYLTAWGATGRLESPALLVPGVEVRYEIADLHTWSGRWRDPEKHLESLVRRALTQALATSASPPDSRALQDVLAKEAAALGVAIRRVDVSALAVPEAVSEADVAITAAYHEAAAARWQARTASAGRAAEGEAEAESAVATARGEAAASAALAAARANWLVAAKSAAEGQPLVFRFRQKLEAMRRSLGGRRLRIVGTRVDRLRLDLKEEARPDILDAPLEAPAEPETADE